MPRCPGRPTARLAVLLGLALLAPPAWAKDEFESLASRLRAQLVHGSLHVRTDAWNEIAATRDPRALALLTAAYDRKGESENGRALLVSRVTDAFGRVEDLPALAAWRQAHADGGDAWLWYRTLVREAENGSPTAALALGRSAREGWQRAAALRALAAVAEPESLALVGEAAAALPEKPLERALVLEALADLWAAHEGRLGSEPYRAAGLWLVGHLERPETPERTGLAIVRALTRVLHPPLPYQEAAFWRDLLSAAAPPPAVDDRYAPPPGARFLELTGTGKRVAYVIDLSGSMQAALSDGEKEDLKTRRPPVVTGKPSGNAKAPPRAPDALDPQALRDLPWDRIRTRLDAAVEFLKLSLRLLPKDAQFAVVVFGTRHAFLEATPGLVEAAPKRIAAAAEELDRLRVSGSTGLMGSTNLHGGLARAMRALDGAMPKKARSGEDLLHGPSTVFVLSDGAPSADDWDDEGGPGRGAGASTYADTDQLLDDAERLNLLRRAEIHCIGIGDGELGLPPGLPLPKGLPLPPGMTWPKLLAGVGFGGLLRGLAKLGHGNYRAVPAPKPEPPPDPLAPSDASLPLIALAKRLLEGATATLRASAAEELARRGDPEAVPELLAALDDREADVRDAVDRALAAFRGRALDDPTPSRSWSRRRLARNWAWWWEQDAARLRAAWAAAHPAAKGGAAEK